MRASVVDTLVRYQLVCLHVSSYTSKLVACSGLILASLEVGGLADLLRQTSSLSKASYSSSSRRHTLVA